MNVYLIMYECECECKDTLVGIWEVTFSQGYINRKQTCYVLFFFYYFFLNNFSFSFATLDTLWSVPLKPERKAKHHHHTQLRY